MVAADRGFNLAPGSGSGPTAASGSAPMSGSAAGLAGPGPASAFSAPPDATNGAPAPGVAAPSLPKGGGALRGIGEKFSANPVTGTVNLSIPLGAPGGRGGFGPQLNLGYDSGAGNGPFGLGWSLGLPAITRKTDKGIPRYDDAGESDVFLLSGSEDLVPVTDRDAFPDTAGWAVPLPGQFADVECDGHRIRFYRPRVEGLYARIERWTHRGTGEIHWRTVTRDDVITVFGPDDESRVADGPDRVFSWLIRYGYDDRGNAVVYDYDAENAASVDTGATHERNREHRARTAQRYLRRVRYGNRTPARDRSTWAPLDLAGWPDADWMFSLVLDYDEGLIDVDPDDERGRIAVRPHRSPQRAWAVRPDPFSSYRSGFEIRTYRRCARVLVLHHFPDELGTADYVVRDTEFTYADSPIAALLTSATQRSYQRLADGRFRRADMPAVELSYSARPGELAGRPVREVDRDAAATLAGALAGTNQWLDLDASGAPGLLAEQRGTWFYTPNLSPLAGGRARFGPQQLVPAQPTATLNGGETQFLDLDADGRPELVDLRDGQRGYYARRDGGWAPFRSLPDWPNLDPRDPNLRFTDVTGDGLADLLVTADRELHWFAGHGRDGFGVRHRVAQALTDRSGPRLLSADATEAVFVSDLSGDGLADLVRVRDGEVCYWPNLGYGRFGRQVVMSRSPRLAGPSGFDPRRVRLADTDGSGPTDLVYLGADGVQVCANQAGNGWAEPVVLPQLRAGDSPGTVQVVDLLGNGTSCVVWTPDRAGEDSRPLRYVALYEHKPDLLVSVVNNLGAETHVGYAPSTRFYLRDQQCGTPWVTRLPFPVQVLETVVTLDRVAHSVFVSRYDYHHGYFDGVEREFRGFGMVEQWDTADIATLGAPDDGSLDGGSLGLGLPRIGALDLEAITRDAANLGRFADVPPVLVRSWFHTGAPVEAGPADGCDPNADCDPDADGLAAALTRDGYRAPGAPEPAGSTLPPGLDAAERREAFRALRGRPLRRETYAADGTERAAHPYEVQIHAHTVRRRQPRGRNRHAVFDVIHRETVAHSYERDPGDPRTTHMLTLDVDDFGNVLTSAAIGYGRRRPDAALGPDIRARQADRLAVWNESSVTGLVDGRDARRTPSTWRARKAEITGLPAPAPGALLSPAQLRAIVDAAPVLPYEAEPQAGPGLRVLGASEITFRADDLSGPLPPGHQGALGLTLTSRRLALTPGLVAASFTDALAGAATDDEVETLLAEGGYLRDVAGWWIPTGRSFFTADSGADSRAELAEARAHFFTARRFRDPFHPDDDTADHDVTYDRHDLLVVETRDPLGSRVTVGERPIDPTKPLRHNLFDYRVLQPRLVMDANRNRSASAFDTHGLVVATAVMGTPEDDPQPGDSLTGLDLDLSDGEIRRALHDAPAGPAALLGNATERIVYDLHAYRDTGIDPQPQPVVSYSIARETHVADLPPGEQSRLQQGFSYSDGFGRGLQDKKLVEAAPGHTAPRWITTGWTVYNNKGKPVRTFEPFFSEHPSFEAAVESGVSTIRVYDPVERVVATLRPDSTWEKCVVTGWSEQIWDVNDTLLLDPRADPDVGGSVRRIDEPSLHRSWYDRRIGGELGPIEQRAAERAAQSAGTPAISHVDTLGRTVLNISHDRRDGVDSFQQTRLVLDIESHARAVVDSLGRTVLRTRYDVAGRMVREDSMDGGTRVALADITGAPLAAWDERGHRFHTGYDVLRRPVHSRLRTGDGPEVMFARTVYGEAEPDAERRNLRGQVIAVHDQSGVVHNREFDFAGRLLLSERRFARAYRELIDCAGEVALEPEAYPARTTWDALGRPTSSTAPDGSITRPHLNQDGLLDRLEVRSQGEAEPTIVVATISYDAHGRRVDALFGNGVRTRYDYDPATFRLVRLRSRRPDRRPAGGKRAGGPLPRTGRRRRLLQDLSCVYDPIGNVMHLRDRAQPRLFFANAAVDADREYSYDALYRLATATGREALGSDGRPVLPESTWPGRAPRLGDEAAMGRYRETFRYDAIGNITSVRHRSADAAHPGWTRDYTYAETSRIEPDRISNRLSRTTAGAHTHHYRYDAGPGHHGLITGMTLLPTMTWDAFDQLQSVARQVVSGERTGERTYYVYDASGARVRTVTERAAPAGGGGGQPRRRRERRYLGAFEQFRTYRGDGSVKLERSTLSLAGDSRWVAAIETRTAGQDRSPGRLVRYALADMAGSVAVELDDDARLLSYEEYYPFGETSLRRQARRVEAPKRYRFSGQERDEESGLYHAGARYFMAWLGRWIAPDPAGLADGTNRYAYVRNNPLKYSDASGMGCDPANQSCADPSASTNAEEAAQACMPDEHPQEENSCQAPPPDPYAAPERDHSLATYTEGDRGERFRDPGDTRPPRPLSGYDKPYAMDAARAGNYEYAELAQNYLCASCHVIAHYGHVPTDDEFSIRTYVSTYKRNYAIGQMMVGSAVFGFAAPEAAALVGAWETGVGTGEVITGHTSGIHVTNLITWDYDGGRKMATDERVFTGVMAGVGWVSMGVGLYGARRGPGMFPPGDPPPPTGGSGGVPANPRQYSTAYETQLNPADYGRSRSVHFNRANAALDADMAANPELAATMEELIPGVRQSVSSPGGRTTPEGWTWEHASTTTANGRTGVMRLVPSEQHTAGSPFWRVLHPDPGAAGGYSEWAIPAGAPRN